MDTNTFWSVIGNYNQHTLKIQIVLMILLSISVTVAYLGKIKWLAKFVLGVVNLYIGIVFLGVFGTEAIQYFFALPLYIACGVMFIYEAIRNKEDILEKPNLWQCFLLALYLIYPLISLIIGKTFPQMVTYIMPCPVISLSIVVYSGYKKKNKILLTLLTIWGLTGVKSLVFNVYEDIILLICGVYGVFLIVNQFRVKAEITTNSNL